MKSIILIMFFSFSFSIFGSSSDEWKIIQSYTKDGAIFENKITISDNNIKIENKYISINFEQKTNQMQIIILPVKTYWMGSIDEFNAELIDYKTIIFDESSSHITELKKEQFLQIIRLGGGRIQNDTIVFDTLIKNDNNVKKLKSNENIAGKSSVKYQITIDSTLNASINMAEKLLKPYMADLIKLSVLIETIGNAINMEFSKSFSYLSYSKINGYPMRLIEFEADGTILLQEEVIVFTKKEYEDNHDNDFILSTEFQKLSLVDLFMSSKSENQF